MHSRNALKNLTPTSYKTQWYFTSHFNFTFLLALTLSPLYKMAVYAGSENAIQIMLLLLRK
jgi:hypothetical protein